jgi:hypothetical protein
MRAIFWQAAKNNLFSIRKPKYSSYIWWGKKKIKLLKRNREKFKESKKLVVL